MDFNPDDVKLVAQHVLDTVNEYDSSCVIGRDGLYYCSDCGVYEDKGGDIVHKHSCITKVAQDLLTGC